MSPQAGPVLMISEKNPFKRYCRHGQRGGRSLVNMTRELWPLVSSEHRLWAEGEKSFVTWAEVRAGTWLLLRRMMPCMVNFCLFLFLLTHHFSSYIEFLTSFTSFCFYYWYIYDGIDRRINSFVLLLEMPSLRMRTLWTWWRRACRFWTMWYNQRWAS